MIEQFTDGIWVDRGPIRIVATRLTVTMTVVRLESGLLVHSPLPLTPERCEKVRSLGAVAHLYAPNTFHHLWLAEWSREFPRALVHAPEALARKLPELHVDSFNGSGFDGFGGELEEIPIVGFRLFETALVHRPSRTAIVTDLVHNIGRPEGTWTKLYSSMMGFYDRVALSRILRWTAFDDRRAARASVDRLLDAPFESLVVGHGAPIASRGHELLANAMQFLPPVTASQLPAKARHSAPLTPKPCG